jgi:hypothetical protein
LTSAVIFCKLYQQIAGTFLIDCVSRYQATKMEQKLRTAYIKKKNRRPEQSKNLDLTQNEDFLKVYSLMRNSMKKICVKFGQISLLFVIVLIMVSSI